MAKNASTLHKHVGELLTSSPLFNGYEIRQEYNVSKINSEFSSNREKIDWVILGLNVCIEVHGEQHYSSVCFGGIDITEAENNFRRQQERDEEKKNAVEEAGWTYIIVKYDEKDIDIDTLSKRIGKAIKDIKIEKSKEKLNGMERKAKQTIQQRSNQPSRRASLPKPDKYNWPKRKLQNRKLNRQN